MKLKMEAKLALQMLQSLIVSDPRVFSSKHSMSQESLKITALEE